LRTGAGAVITTAPAFLFRDALDLDIMDLCTR
jgi:hypothetical protein